MMIIDIALLVSVVIALTEVLKRVFHFNTRYLPFVSLVIGVIAGIIYLEGSLKETALYGIIIGLSASGLFDQTKIITKGDE